VDAHAVDAVQESIEKVKAEGGEILFGGEKLNGDEFNGGAYMRRRSPASRRHRDREARDVWATAYLMTYSNF
jgi:hypothetical protein